MSNCQFSAYCCAFDSYNTQALFPSDSTSNNSASVGHMSHSHASKTKIQTRESNSPHSNGVDIKSMENCTNAADQPDQSLSDVTSPTIKITKTNPRIFVLNQQIRSVFDPLNSHISQASLPCPLPSSIRNLTYVSLFDLQGTILTHSSEGGVCLWLEHASGGLVVLSSLSHFRQFHGMVYVQGRVYVFGGEWLPNQPLNCGESLYVQGSLETSPWTYLPNPMVRPRAHTSPCVHRDLVYLAGGGHPSIEAFNPRDQCFRPLDLQLFDQSGCIMVADEEKLVIITQLFVYKVHLGTLETEVVKHRPYCMQVNAPALLYGGWVYAARNGKLISIDVATGVLRDEDICH